MLEKEVDYKKLRMVKIKLTIKCCIYSVRNFTFNSMWWYEILPLIQCGLFSGNFKKKFKKVLEKDVDNKKLRMAKIKLTIKCCIYWVRNFTFNSMWFVLGLL